jgi:hypothetical protein
MFEGRSCSLSRAFTNWTRRRSARKVTDLSRPLYQNVGGKPLERGLPVRKGFGLAWKGSKTGHRGTAIGRGGEFDEPPKNACQAGFLLSRRSREGASSSTSTLLALFSPSPNRLLLFHRASSHVLHAPMRRHGTGEKGWHSTSRAVHCRVVLPAAMAGVRWRFR